jgi:hypothetical protein
MEKEGGESQEAAGGILDSYKEALAKIYKIYDNTELPSEVGTARFVKHGLEFEVEGRFATAKDADGKGGRRFAFEITATKLTKKPENYDDMYCYEHTDFVISVGYRDGEPFPDDSEETGVMIPNISDTEGRIFELNYKSCYDFDISTAETDEMDKGQIKFLNRNDGEQTIAFKFAVSMGLNDVVVGAVSLKEDREWRTTENF